MNKGLFVGQQKNVKILFFVILFLSFLQGLKAESVTPTLFIQKEGFSNKEKRALRQHIHTYYEFLELYILPLYLSSNENSLDEESSPPLKIYIFTDLYQMNEWLESVLSLPSTSENYLLLDIEQDKQQVLAFYIDSDDVLGVNFGKEFYHQGFKLLFFENSHAIPFWVLEGGALLLEGFKVTDQNEPYIMRDHTKVMEYMEARDPFHTPYDMPSLLNNNYTPPKGRIREATRSAWFLVDFLWFNLGEFGVLPIQQALIGTDLLSQFFFEGVPHSQLISTPSGEYRYSINSFPLNEDLNFWYQLNGEALDMYDNGVQNMNEGNLEMAEESFMITEKLIPTRESAWLLAAVMSQQKKWEQALYFLSLAEQRGFPLEDVEDARDQISLEKEK